MADESGNVPEIILLRSEVEAAAARVAERALNDAWGGFSDFAGDAFGGIIGDRTKLWRTRNLVASLAKTHNRLVESGVNLKHAKSLPMGELFSIFEGTSKTDDPDLREMWSALLANSMNPTKDTFTDPSFVRLLNELSGLDARILSYLYVFDERFKQYKNELKAINGSLGGEDLVSASVRELKASEAMKRYEAFRTEAEKMRSDLIDTTASENISYSISNLARLGVVDIPLDNLSRAALLNVHQDFRTSKVIIGTQRLEEELSDLRRRIAFGFASDKKLPKVISDPKDRDIPSPGYTLTDYGRRFVEACR